MELVDMMEGGVRAEAGRTLLALAEACEKQRTAKSVLRDGWRSLRDLRQTPLQGPKIVTR
jgi:hypothetical protein